jgi:hypothetical protein
MRSICFRFLMVGFFLYPPVVHGDMMTKPAKEDKSPSKDQVMWTETDVGYDLGAEYSYVGSGKTDFGHGNSGNVSEEYTDIQHTVTRREMLAFLLHGGMEWQRTGLAAPRSLSLPNELDVVNLFLAADFRWSEKSMMRVQFQPGLYTDGNDIDGHDINVPIAIAYTRIPSKKFQWAIGLSINTWRSSRYLPGGGFRYYINDRWKLKFMLPKPQIEYKASDVLHVWIGTDFRGDTYRVSRTFGDRNGNPALNDALLSYQEIRVGTGFSWNIKPLLEFNGEAGWMVDRSFKFGDTGVHSGGNGAPYVGLNIRFLFQLVKDSRPIPAQIRSMQYEFPALQQFFKLPS